MIAFLFILLVRWFWLPLPFVANVQKSNWTFCGKELDQEICIANANYSGLR